jgi:hypothetical protein
MKVWEDPPADPRWSEQDRAVQNFLRHTYRNFLDLKPVLLSDLTAKMNKLRDVAGGLHQQAATLQSLGKQSDAQKLEEIASDCDEEARKCCHVMVMNHGLSLVKMKMLNYGHL